MNIYPLSTNLPVSNGSEKLAPEQMVPLNSESVEKEVSLLSKFSSSISELFEKSKNYVDQNIDARNVMIQADKIVENLAKERDKYLPKEKEWNEEISTFISDFQNQGKDRKEILKSFLTKLEESYTTEIKVINTLQNIGEETVRLENLAMQFTAIGHKIGEVTSLIDESSLNNMKLTLEGSSIAVPWVKVGLMSHNNSLLVRKIEFCEAEVRNAVEQLKSGNLTNFEITNLESKIEMTEKIIFDLKAQQSNLIYDIVKQGFDGSEIAFRKGRKPYSSGHT